MSKSVVRVMLAKVLLLKRGFDYVPKPIISILTPKTYNKPMHIDCPVLCHELLGLFLMKDAIEGLYISQWPKSWL